MSISLRIKEIRNRNKMSGKEFSFLLGIDNSQFSKIEQGKLMPTLNQIMEISSNFNISLDWLLNGEGTIFKNELKDNSNTGTVVGSNIGGSIGGHFINIIEQAEFEKIIREKEVEITRQSAMSQKVQKRIDDLNAKIDGLEQLLKSKDDMINYLNKTLDLKDEIIAAKDNIITLLQGKNMS